MFESYFNYLSELNSNNDIKHVFVHNLGAFDGIFILRYAIKIFSASLSRIEIYSINYG